ncbi:MAG: hypothetical protein ACOC4M_14515 [Promethearchaeia archaeon]
MEKTDSMKKFEKATGKNAIWQGKITQQFKTWERENNRKKKKDKKREKDGKTAKAILPWDKMKKNEIGEDQYWDQLKDGQGRDLLFDPKPVMRKTDDIEDAVKLGIESFFKHLEIDATNLDIYERRAWSAHHDNPFVNLYLLKMLLSKRYQDAWITEKYEEGYKQHTNYAKSEYFSKKVSKALKAINKKMGNAI